MNYPDFLLLTLLLSTASLLPAQDLSAHRWEDRLIVVLADHPDHPQLNAQLTELATQPSGLRERRLVIYQILPKAYRCQLSDTGNWQNAQGVYTDLKDTGSSFEVLLLGLDGGVKLRETEPVSCKTFFSLIDQMPMRRAEMKRKGN